MRSYAEELEGRGLRVCYQKMAPSPEPYEEHLSRWLRAEKIERLLVFEIEDKFFETRILKLLRREKIAVMLRPSPMFLTSRQDFASYLSAHKRPFMKTFYQAQRRRLGVLMQDPHAPVGGKWSFDADNRRPLPGHIDPPALPQVAASAHVRAAQRACSRHFAGHPGTADGCWLPVTRRGAKAWLQAFLRQRLRDFGPYEDALTERSDAVFHGVLSPMLNVGLLTPEEVLQQALRHARQDGTPLASLEGFVRQIIGWREFIRGVYQNFSAEQHKRNHFGHTRKLSQAWYGSATGVPPLDAVLAKVLRLGWAHHIERLMVLGSMMLLLQVHPHEAHRWFMEMFVDSSDWVMGPNVYGMALHSDGGIFATKPYLCGSNYYRKMGGYPKGDWCDGVDGLYWRFMERHRAFFARNPRLAAVARGVDRLAVGRKERIYAAADALQAKLTQAA